MKLYNKDCMEMFSEIGDASVVKLIKRILLLQKNV